MIRATTDNPVLRMDKDEWTCNWHTRWCHLCVQLSLEETHSMMTKCLRLSMSEQRQQKKQQHNQTQKMVNERYSKWITSWKRRDKWEMNFLIALNANTICTWLIASNEFIMRTMFCIAYDDISERVWERTHELSLNMKCNLCDICDDVQSFGVRRNEMKLWTCSHARKRKDSEPADAMCVFRASVS